MKIPEFFQTPIFKIGGVLAAAALVFILAILAVDYLREKKVNSEVNNQTTESSRQIGIAEQSTANANVSAAARQTEDIIREKVIKPKLNDARAKSKISQAELETARQNLNDAKNNLHNLNVTRADNCRALRELFPNEQFEYCADDSQR